MISYRVVTALFVLNLGFIARGQSVTSTGGTANAVPKYSNATTITPSAIYESSGSVGIGTTSPVSPLSVVGTSATVGTVNLSTPNTTDAPFIDFNIQGIGVYGQITDNNGINFKSRGNLLFTPSASGGVGIKTTTPQQALDVNGSIKISGANGALIFPDGTSLSTAPTSSPTQTNTGTGTMAQTNTFPSSGNVGIGTMSPQTSLDIGMLNSANSLLAGVTIENIVGDGNYNSPMLLLGSGNWFNNGQFLRAAALQAVNDNWNVGQKALAFYTYDGHLGNNFANATLADLYEKMRISSSGNVGIGTTAPGAALEVNGNVKLTNGSGASITFADNTVQSTAWNGTLCGGDYAESVDVLGARKQYEPGDVLVVDTEHPGQFKKTSEPYSMSVAGIYSTKPGLTGRRQSGDPKAATTEVPMAMVGIVPTKVTAENGPIHPGDVLVTSSILGYAMKGTDRSLFAGAIVGKSLGTLDNGTGIVEVLVSLQ